MRAILLSPLLLLVACATPGAPSAPAVALRDIEDGTGGLAAWFDREQEHPRAIFLLSPV